MAKLMGIGKMGKMKMDHKHSPWCAHKKIDFKTEKKKNPFLKEKAEIYGKKGY